MKKENSNQVSKNSTNGKREQSLELSRRGIPLAQSQLIMKGFILASICLSASSLFAPLALAGGGHEGGGHEIEAGFKTKVLDIFNDLSNMSTPSQSLLKFDADEVLATLNTKDRFKPHCATGATLERMRAENKMARVYPQDLSVVNINCTDYSIDQWNSLFQSDESKDIIFFIHEALRVAGKESEDDYGPSSSFGKAERKEKEAAKAATFKMLYSESSSKCKLNVSSTRALFGGCNKARIRFLVNGDVAWDSQEFCVDQGQDDAWIRQSLLETYSKKVDPKSHTWHDRVSPSLDYANIKIDSKKIFELARDYGCVSDVKVTPAALNPNGVVEAVSASRPLDQSPQVTNDQLKRSTEGHSQERGTDPDSAAVTSEAK